jgi:hypothetical protein
MDAGRGARASGGGSGGGSPPPLLPRGRAGAGAEDSSDEDDDSIRRSGGGGGGGGSRSVTAPHASSSSSGTSRWTCEACGCHTNTAADRSCSICGTSQQPLGKRIFLSLELFCFSCLSLAHIFRACALVFALREQDGWLQGVCLLLVPIAFCSGDVEEDLLRRHFSFLGGRIRAHSAPLTLAATHKRCALLWICLLARALTP